MTEARYRLIGSTASPYAIKLRALLRYRRIPHDWVIMTKALRKATEHLRPNLIPVLQYPDDTFRGETTLLHRLLGASGGKLERFRAKWAPVRVKKTRQNKMREPGSDSIRTNQALADQSLGKSLRIAISAASPGDSTVLSKAGWRSVTMS